jgi:cell wall assembly regulator SMI1
MSHVLTSESVTEFDRALAQRVPAVRACLQPGATDAHVQAELLAIGLESPQELLLWWSYFDGPVEPCNIRPFEMLPGLEFLSISTAARAYRRLREIGAETAGAGPSDAMHPEDIWNPRWIPIFGILSGGEIIVDCSDGATEPCPLRVSYPDDPDAQLLASNLGTFIADATAWLNAGTHHFDADRGRWPLESWTSTDLTERFRA